MVRPDPGPGEDFPPLACSSFAGHDTPSVYCARRGRHSSRPLSLLPAPHGPPASSGVRFAVPHDQRGILTRRAFNPDAPRACATAGNPIPQCRRRRPYASPLPVLLHDVDFRIQRVGRPHSGFDGGPPAPRPDRPLRTRNLRRRPLLRGRAGITSVFDGGGLFSRESYRRISTTPSSSAATENPRPVRSRRRSS